ncbi:MAG: PEP-CTERM sorting domain-containing protein [Akkermansia sp.]|nr:PEP-CTERM sorting domain-containing protein [Akkermansia sp.]
MKLHLPIALFAFVSAAVQAAPLTPEKIMTVSDGEVKYATDIANTETGETFLEMLQTTQTIPANDKDNSGGGAIIKDGAGELKVTSGFAPKDGTSTSLTNTLVVREGTLTFGAGKEATHVAITNNPAKINSPNLVVGGKNGRLVFDNASYVQVAGSYVSSINIGTPDGAGHMELKNGSYVANTQTLFGGYNVTSSDHVHATWTDGTQKSVYQGVQGTSTLDISGGSKYAVGTCFYFGNMDVKVTDEGSVFEDGNRYVDNKRDKSDIVSFMGDLDNSNTTIRIEEGADWYSRNRLIAGYADGSTTTIDVKGEGSTFNSSSIVAMGYDSTLPGGSDENYKSTSVFTVSDKAQVNVVDLRVGNSGSAEATLTVDETSSYNGSSISVGKKGYISNSGTITLNDGATGDYYLNNSDYMVPDAAHEFAEDKMTSVDSALTVSGRLENTATGKILTSDDALLNIVGGGLVENSGNIGLSTVVNGGALTLNGGSMAAVTLIDGDIYVNGATTTGALTLTGGTITFNLDAQVATYARNATPATMLTVDSLDVTGTKIVVNLSDEAFNKLDGSTFNLFKVEGEEGADLSGADIVFTNGTQSKVGTVTANEDGSFTVKDTKLVPEPTTATLSLLALAALAARRRRR